MLGLVLDLSLGPGVARVSFIIGGDGSPVRTTSSFASLLQQRAPVKGVNISVSKNDSLPPKGHRGTYHFVMMCDNVDGVWRTEILVFAMQRTSHLSPPSRSSPRAAEP